jgi:TRAP-type uncharacterized transport system fused permease subunit
MVASILLGLGLPTTAKYIILAAMAAPAIQQFGISMLAAHLFIFYFGIFADITPPVALASYAAAGIAKSDATKTSLVALKLALAGFLVPFVFIYSPGLLLMQPEWAEVVKWSEGIAMFIPELSQRLAENPEWWTGFYRWTNVLTIITTTVIGISALAFASAGYWLRNLHVFERVIVLAAAIALIFPGLIIDMVGVALLVTVYLTQKWWPGKPTDHVGNSC